MLLEISKILVKENRHRQNFDEDRLMDLVNSISTYGLMHPLVVEGNAISHFHLVAGERRLRAIKRIYELGLTYTFEGKEVLKNFVPVTSLPSLSDLDAKEMELHENIEREDLTWQERVAADAELVELRRLRAVAEGRPEPTYGQIAESVGLSRSAGAQIKENATIAEMLSDPEVAAAPTLKEAKKVAERKVREAYHRKLTAEMEGKAKVDTLFAIRGNGLEYLEQHPREFDIVITDPPYGVSAHEMGAQANAAGRDFDDSAETWSDLMQSLSENAYISLKEVGAIYVFCSPEMFEALHTIFAEHGGWDLWPRPLIWAKGNGVLPVPSGGPRYTYETILYARKGPKKTIKVADDVLFHRMQEKSLHPDAKPWQLYADLLSRITMPGDKIIDPFAGSGPVLEAGYELKLFTTAVEKSELYFGGLLTRLETLK